MGVALEDNAVCALAELHLFIYLVVGIQVCPSFDLLAIELYCHYFILFLILSFGKVSLFSYNTGNL